MTLESKYVSEDLQRWAKELGFSPGGKFVTSYEYPSPDIFHKICKGKTINFWQNVMKQVRSKEEALHIQKNLLLQSLKSRKSLEEHSSLSYLSRQVVLSSKLDAKNKEISQLLESIERQENSIKSRELALRKSAHKIAGIQSQIDEFKVKVKLFQIKQKECHSTVIWCQEVATVASGLCPPQSNSKPLKAQGSETAVTTLYKCIDAIHDYHGKCHSREGSENNKSESDSLKQLWEQVKSSIHGWGAQQLWDALTLDILPQHMKEMSDLWEKEPSFSNYINRSAHHNVLPIDKEVYILPAKCMLSTLECMNLRTKAEIKKKELESVKEKLANALEENLKSSQPQLTTTFSEVIRAWLDAQSKKAEISGKLQAIKQIISKMKKTKPTRAVLSANLRPVQEELARLNLQKDQLKKQIEENLAFMRSTSSRIKSASEKALAAQSSFVAQIPDLFQVQERTCSDVESPAPSRSGPFSSTMIENHNIDSNLSFNTSFSTTTSERSGGNPTLSEMLAISKDSVSKEAKLFIKLRLNAIPSVLINGKREPVSNLITMAPMMTSPPLRLSQSNFLRMMQGSPFRSSPHIILNQLATQSNERAFAINKLLYACPSPALKAQIYLYALHGGRPKQDQDLLEKIAQVNASISDFQPLLLKTEKNLQMWIERPLQDVVSALNLKVKGQSFKEWLQLYDEKNLKKQP